MLPITRHAPNYSVAVIRYSTVFMVICAVSANHLQAHAASTELLYEPTQVELAEGELSGKVTVQLRGRNIADDWVEIVRKLQNTSNPPRYVEVAPPPGGGLCQTYVKQLRLPGCSHDVRKLAKELNPHVVQTLYADQKVKVPVLPLHADIWTIVLDRDTPSDKLRLKDLNTRWKSAITKRQTSNNLERLFVKAYNIYLPNRLREQPDIQVLGGTKLKSLVLPTFDRTVRGHSLQKSVIQDSGNIIEKLFSVSLSQRLADCREANYQHAGPMPYSILLGQAELPQCAKACTGACPEINLFDNKVYLHSDIKKAVIYDGTPVAVGREQSHPKCDLVEFSKPEHHGTMLASIMVAQDHNSSQFTGLAPRAKLRIYNANRLGGRDKKWARLLQDLGVEAWTTPQVFVFAGQFKFRDRYLDDAGLLSEDIRIGHPAPVTAIIKNKLIWITSAGHYDSGSGRQLTKSAPLSPMNLGDQESIIVVTSCGSDCTGKDARLWDNAHWSNVDDGLVNLAAPGGTRANPIPGAADDHSYSKAWGTSQATAFVGGLAGAMLSCFPQNYKEDGRRIKTRLQVTADPMSRREDARVVTGGIVNLERALLDPNKNWIDIGDGFKQLTNLSWCSDNINFAITESAEDFDRIPVSKIGSIIRYHDDANGQPQWQVARANVILAKVNWTGVGNWLDANPILQGDIESQGRKQKIYATGQEIISFLPNEHFRKIKVKSCSSPG